MKALTQGREALGDVVVAEVVADDGAVLALHQGVVVALASPRLGELADVQFVEQRGDLMVDVLRAVVGMKAHNLKRIGVDEGFEHRNEEALGDRLHGADVLVLGDLVHGVDVVHPFRPIEVALVDGVHAHESRLPVGAGLAALCDGHGSGSGLGEHGTLAPIGARLAQVVQVSVRQSRQTLEASIAEDLELPAKHRASGRGASLPQRRVHLGEQAHVRRGVAAHEGTRRPTAATVADAPR